MTAMVGCDTNRPSLAQSREGTPTQPTDPQAVARQRTAAAIARLRQERDALKRAATAPAGHASAATSHAASPGSRKTASTRRPAPGPATGSTGTESFAALARRIGGSIGLAYAPLGVGHPAKTMGQLHTGVSWSTMKVPVAIATIKQANGHPSPSTMALMRLAITESDNTAAMAMWSRLGTPTTAAAKTQAVLRAGGDNSTVVPANTRRPGYTPFGQSDWPLAAQATFAASLPCIANTNPVLALMAQVTPSQRWGVGSMGSTIAFKGGWGPGTDGKYLVRQLAVVRVADGTRIGLAIASLPADGQFQTGVNNLDAIAHWAAQHIRAGGRSGC